MSTAPPDPATVVNLTELTDAELETHLKPLLEEQNRRIDQVAERHRLHITKLRTQYGVTVLCPCCEGFCMHHHRSDSAVLCSLCGKTGTVLLPVGNSFNGIHPLMDEAFPAFIRIHQLFERGL